MESVIKSEGSVRTRKEPRLRKMAGEGLRLPNVIKRMNISERIGKEHILKNMDRRALVHRIGRCYEVNVAYCTSIRNGSRLGKMRREALEPKNIKCHKENVAYCTKD